MSYSSTAYVPEKHREGLTKLWREDFLDAKIRDHVDERMRWLYEQNPRGPATTYLSLVAEDETVVGCATYFPRHVLVHGKDTRAGVLCDFAVDKHHRIAGAAIAVQRGLAKTSWPSQFRFLFGFPNEGSVAVCKRVGYKVVGSTTTWVKPLRSGYKVRTFTPAPFMVKPAAAIVDAGLSVVDKTLGALIGGASPVEELDVPDQRFDRLWERARPSRGVLGERTRDYLEWRYTRFTTHKHWFFCMTKDDGRELAGYVAYSLEDNHAILQDLFCENFEEAADALLIALAQHLRQKNVWSIVLSYLGPSIFGERLARLGFFKRPGERVMVVYLDAALPDAEKREILDPANWFMLDGELDI
jgi:hypothetical protein